MGTNLIIFSLLYNVVCVISFRVSSLHGTVGAHSAQRLSMQHVAMQASKGATLSPGQEPPKTAHDFDADYNLNCADECNIDRRGEYSGLFQLSEQSAAFDRLACEVDGAELIAPLARVLEDLDAALLIEDDTKPIPLSAVEKGLDKLLKSNTGTGCKEIETAVVYHLKDKYQGMLTESPILERIVSKPQGYTGDYLTIEWMYDNRPRDIGSYNGRRIDQAALELVACKAVQNRRGLLTSVFSEAVAERSATDSSPLQVASMACGPAREVYDFFHQDPARMDICFQLIDLDADALLFVQSWCDEMTIKPHQVTLHQKNLLLGCVGRERINLPQQDLMYSMGLIDYLSDKTIIRLLNFVHENLRAGGKVVLGQFHTRNPTRGLMDTILEWKLIHRNEDDMNRIFSLSKFNSHCTEIVYDATGTQMLCCCEK
tara:strand:- start:67 stop:1353 length:1287 start_codon:yes stop_codon:yes gene_type:complete